MARLTPREVGFASGAALLFFLFAFAAERWLGALATSAIAAGLVLVLVSAAIVLYRHIEDRAEEERAQVEAIVALYHALGPSLPLPPLRGYALAPDSALLLYSLVRRCAPKLVLEIGSGTSSLIIGYALRAEGQGRLVSLELDRDYAERTRQEIARHGLGERVTVLHAPLEELTLEDEKMRWHDPRALDGIEAIDLVFDDGPPKRLGPNLRLAALPLLWPRLAPDATYCLNFIAGEERKNVARWLARHPELEAETVRTKKGNVILRRRVPSQP